MCVGSTQILINFIYKIEPNAAATHTHIRTHFFGCVNLQQTDANAHQARSQTKMEITAN